MFCDYWDCDVIVKIVENTSDCRSAIYEKLQRIKRRSEGLGAASVLVTLYSGEKVELIRDLTKINVSCTDEELVLSPKERSQILQVLFKILIKCFGGDCTKLIDTCRNADRFL